MDVLLWIVHEAYI